MVEQSSSEMPKSVGRVGGTDSNHLTKSNNFIFTPVSEYGLYIHNQVN
jgi:hypothetical protein